MQPVVVQNIQQNFSDASQSLPQNQSQGPDADNATWGYRDIAMFSGQGISGLGALVTFALGGLNTASTTLSGTNISNTQPPSSLTTGNSYVLIGFGILFTLGTLIQAGSHYHWRQDVQDAKNTNLKSLGDELEKDLQEFQVIVEKTEAIRKKIGALNQTPVNGPQIPLAEEKKRPPDNKTIPQMDDLNDTSGKITIKT